MMVEDYSKMKKLLYKLADRMSWLEEDKIYLEEEKVKAQL